MSKATIELQLPDEVYERARQIAGETNRSVEAVLLDSLNLLYSDLPNLNINADDLGRYSDEQLWAIVYQRLAWYQDSRLHELIALGKQGRLTEEDTAEMERLISLVDRVTLLRSRALLLLKQRGHEVEKQLKLGA